MLSEIGQGNSAIYPQVRRFEPREIRKNRVYFQVRVARR